jgi:Lar family restriction alleviation protein
LAKRCRNGEKRRKSEVERMGEIKLLPCPFCGGNKLYIAERNYFGEQFVQISCLGCHTSQAGSEYETKEEAIAAWNQRKPMERILERLKEKHVESEKCPKFEKSI